MPYRFALVTGASSGIGAAFARALPADTGLFLTGRSEDRLAAVHESVAREGRRIEALAADLTTPEGRRTVIEAAETAEIDLFVNNAGTGPFGAVVANPPETERATVELNVVAVEELTRALLPGMIARAARDGRRAGLILVSSTTAFQPVPYLATYSASKAFILAYGEALAAELRGKPVDVLVLCPGATRTEFGRRAGFAVGSLPGADNPDTVARQGLAALGRRTVHVVGLGKRAALAPFLWSRHAAAGGLRALLSTLDHGHHLGRTPRP